MKFMFYINVLAPVQFFPRRPLHRTSKNEQSFRDRLGPRATGLDAVVEKSVSPTAPPQDACLMAYVFSRAAAANPHRSDWLISRAGRQLTARRKGGRDGLRREDLELKPPFAPPTWAVAPCHHGNARHVFWNTANGNAAENGTGQPTVAPATACWRTAAMVARLHGG